LYDLLVLVSPLLSPSTLDPEIIHSQIFLKDVSVPKMHPEEREVRTEDDCRRSKKQGYTSAFFEEVFLVFTMLKRAWHIKHA